MNRVSSPACTPSSSGSGASPTTDSTILSSALPASAARGWSNVTGTIALVEELSSSSPLYGSGDTCRQEDVVDRAGDGEAVLTRVAAAITWLYD